MGQSVTPQVAVMATWIASCLNYIRQTNSLSKGRISLLSKIIDVQGKVTEIPKGVFFFVLGGTDLSHQFLSSTNKVSTGPTCQKVYVCVYEWCALYFRSFSVTNFLGF